MKKLFIVISGVMLLSIFLSDSFASTIQINNSTNDVYVKSMGYNGGSLIYTAEYGVRPTAGDYAEHGYMYSRVLVKFDLSEWYKLNIPKESITGIKFYIYSSGGYYIKTVPKPTYSLFDISQDYKNDLNIPLSSAYYNAAVGDALITNGATFNYTFSADFLETFLENDIDNDKSGVGSNTTYAGFIIIQNGHPASEKEYNYYYDHTMTTNAPYLEITYNENFSLIPEPLTVISITIACLVGLIKKRL